MQRGTKCNVIQQQLHTFRLSCTGLSAHQQALVESVASHSVVRSARKSEYVGRKNVEGLGGIDLSKKNINDYLVEWLYKNKLVKNEVSSLLVFVVNVQRSVRVDGDANVVGAGVRQAAMKAPVDKV